MPFLKTLFRPKFCQGYVKQGKKNFVLIPIAFVNEHIETLHELDIEYCKELAEEVLHTHTVESIFDPKIKRKCTKFTVVYRLAPNKFDAQPHQTIIRYLSMHWQLSFRTIYKDPLM